MAPQSACYQGTMWNCRVRSLQALDNGFELEHGQHENAAQVCPCRNCLLHRTSFVLSGNELMRFWELLRGFIGVGVFCIWESCFIFVELLAK